jgi:hypothetical protein
VTCSLADSDQVDARQRVSLPEEWHQTVWNHLLVVRVARQFVREKLLLINQART